MIRLSTLKRLFGSGSDELSRGWKYYLKHPCSNYLFAIRIPAVLKGLFNIKDMESGSSEEWDDYYQEYKRHHPYWYWFEKVFMDKVQDIFCYLPNKYKNIRVYIVNRFFDKTHYLQTLLTKGQYFEIDRRFIHGLFTTLVIFIEEEKGVWGEWSFGKDFPGLSNREYGLKYLDWEINQFLVEGQSSAAEEQLALYTWWTIERPSRIDPSILIREELPEDLSELESYYKEHHNPNDEEDRFSKEYVWKYHAHNTETERQYQEDTEMAIRLIKIRNYLWT